MDCSKRRSSVASDLPEESLVEILARVPARSVCRSKCVAKAWRDVIEDPFYRKKLPQTLQGFLSITETYGLGLRLHIDYVSLLARSARLQIDPSLSFLTKLPGFESLTFLVSCNGLLVFQHTEMSLGYVVCNPTTEQWGPVPRYGPPPSSPSSMYTGSMYLVFDPAVSSHFHLVQFERKTEKKTKGFVVDDDEEEEDGNGGYVDNYQGRRHQQHSHKDVVRLEFFIASMNVYSSESGQWIHIESGFWDKHNTGRWRHVNPRSAVLNGMLHFIIYGSNDKVQIAAVDVEGVTRKIIPLPIMAGAKHWPAHYIAQSQGCLHYINNAADAQLTIWVLDDYDTQKWVFKHSVSFLELFGKRIHWRSRASRKNDYSVVAMHPDGNVVFIVRGWDRKLISYDMDHKLVSVIRTFENDTSTMRIFQNGTSTMHAVPYVPCFVESPALKNKH